MISLIRQLLELDNYYGVSKNIDTAKGCNEFTLNLKKRWVQHKRQKAWHKKST